MEPSASRLLLLLVHLTAHVMAQPNFTLEGCYDSANNFTNESIYQRNLNYLLSSIKDDTDNDSGFYNRTHGQSPDQVNILALCRGDTSLDICRSCIYNSTIKILEVCPFQKEALGIYDLCMVRYSNNSIFGNAQTRPALIAYTTANASDMNTFSEEVRKLSIELRSTAASGNSLKKFATKEVSSSGFDTIYGLVQCTPDLSGKQCDDCLLSNFRDSLQFQGKLGGVVMGPSCQFRYETYPFYGNKTIPPPPPTEGTTGAPNLQYYFCDNSITFTTNSSYKTSLTDLLSSLSSNAASNNVDGFFSTSSGQDPDKVYGLFLCRGDISTEVCHACVSDAAKGILQLCPIQETAVVWFDKCLLRYSNRSFTTVDPRPSKVLLDADPIGVDANFYELLAKTITDAASEATAGRSEPKNFAVKKVTYTWEQSVYVLVQCTPDLSGSDCNRCLRQANESLPQPVVQQGGQVLYPSCSIRFGFDPFYDETETGGKGRKSIRIKVIASLSAVGGILLLGFGVYMMRIRKQYPRQEEEEGGHELWLTNDFGRGRMDDFPEVSIQAEMKSQDLPWIPLDAILHATEHFSDTNKLGRGGFGPVYKGVLEDGKEIAVKRLSKTSVQGNQEFMNEIKLIARLQHRNLVRLLGCCLQRNEKLLIYEYMPNKSLDFWLFDPKMGEQLDWKIRVSVINGSARGLLYLHEDSRLRIIHRDFKASNVLLDYEMNPKISDFGMARIFEGNQDEASTRELWEHSIGYMAPEYAMGGLFSVKSDVFSFGVLILEIVSGRRNSNFHLSIEGESLLTYAWKLWSKGQGLELLDPLLLKSSAATPEVLKCIHIGLLCVQEDPADRPNMSLVVLMLRSDTITLPQPTEPAFSVGRQVGNAAQSSSGKICSLNEVTVTNIAPR